MKKRKLQFFYLFLLVNYVVICSENTKYNKPLNSINNLMFFEDIEVNEDWFEEKINKAPNNINFIVIKNLINITTNVSPAIMSPIKGLFFLYGNSKLHNISQDNSYILVDYDMELEYLTMSILNENIRNNNKSVVLNKIIELEKEQIDVLITILINEKITIIERVILNEFIISPSNSENFKYFIENVQKAGIKIKRCVFINMNNESNLWNSLNTFISKKNIVVENMTIKNTNFSNKNHEDNSLIPFDVPEEFFSPSIPRNNNKELEKYSRKNVDTALKEKSHILPETMKKILDLHERSYTTYAREANNPRMSDEARYFKNIMDILLRLPNKIKIRKINIKIIQKILDECMEGFIKEKQYFINACMEAMETGEFNMPTVMYVGPPGVGKTAMATAFAKVFAILSSNEKTLSSSILNDDNKFGEVMMYVNKNYQKHLYKISINTIKDILTLTGTTPTFVNAKPGLLLESFLTEHLVVVLVDEIDKVQKSQTGSDDNIKLKSAIQDALLTLMEDNGKLIDLYFEIPLGKGSALLYLTANNIDNIDTTLRDRLKIFTIKGLLNEEKNVIFLRSIFEVMNERRLIKHNDKPKLITKNNKNFYSFGERFLIEKDILQKIVNMHSSLDGARVLKRYVQEMVANLGLKVRENASGNIEINYENIGDFITFDENMGSFLPDVKNQHIGAMRMIYSTSNGSTEIFALYALNVNTRSHYGDIHIIDGDESKYNANNSYSTLLSAILRNLSTILPKELVSSLGLQIISSHLNSNYLVIRLPNDADKKEYRRMLVSALISCISAIRRKPLSQDVLIIGEFDEAGHFYCDDNRLITKLVAAKRFNIKTVIVPSMMKQNPVFMSSIKQNKDFGLNIIYMDNLGKLIQHFFEEAN